MIDEGAKPSPSRRAVLQGAVAGSAGLAAAARAAPREGRPDRRFRALVRHGTGAQVLDLELLPRRPDEVVVRTEASAVCYTIVRGLLSGAVVERATIPNHSGFGVVEEVGPLVRRVKVGDRVVVCGTPQCGQCYQCLHGRPDWCNFMTVDLHPIARTGDGTPVYEGGYLGGLSELMVVTEEYLCPVFSKVSSLELSLLGDTAGTGLAAGMNLAPIEPGSDVVVIGCGPVGLGAVQSARIKAAKQIIAIEPIKARRELALKLGATLALDPNAEGDRLVERVRDLCKGRTDRVFAGGRVWTDDFNVPRGADFTIEAVGGQSFPPKVETGPDPTGVLAMRQAWEFTRAGGHVVYLGFGQQGDVTIPAWQLANRGRTLHSGQQGGMHMMRDLPRYVNLVEDGRFDLKSMITATYSLDRAMEAVQAVADRTQVVAVVTFPA